MGEQAEFEALFFDRRAEGVQIGFATSLNCRNHTIEEGQGLPAGTIPGIDTFVARLASKYGDVVSGSGTDCARQLYCGAKAANATLRRLNSQGAGPECQGDWASLPLGCQTCLAGNKLIEAKAELRSLQTYRCDLFEDPRAPHEFCDPKVMIRSANGVWTRDCMGRGPSGEPVWRVKPRTCSFAQFVKYVQDFDL